MEARRRGGGVRGWARSRGMGDCKMKRWGATEGDEELGRCSRKEEKEGKGNEKGVQVGAKEEGRQWKRAHLHSFSNISLEASTPSRAHLTLTPHTSRLTPHASHFYKHRQKAINRQGADNQVGRPETCTHIIASQSLKEGD